VKRSEFLRQNEKKFARLLVRLRGNLYLPRREEDFDGAYRASIKRITKDYAENYHNTMEVQLGASTKVATAFMLAVGYRYSTIGANPVVGIAEKVAEQAMFAELPSGFTLSGRIWDLGTYSDDILKIVENGMRNHLNPEMLAKQLDGFTLPNRHVDTLTPYGRSLNFDSMRLARTEIIHAERVATKEAMDKSPWVTSLTFDGSDGCVEFCQPLDGLEITSEMDIPEPHSQCNCPVIENVLSYEEWNEALDQYAQDGTDNLGIKEWLEL